MSWYNSSYHNKKQITIDHTKVVGTNQYNFPVLVSLTDSDLKTASNGGKVQNASGFDIIFVDGTETTKLDHEIKKYVPTTGELEMYVRFSTLSNVTDTSFFIYFSNSGISTSQENVHGVWDSNYQGVWHLGNGSTLSLADSTSHANNGTNNGATANTGILGGAASFNGSTNNIDTPSQAAMSTFTLQAWINTNSTSAQAILAQGDSGADQNTFYWRINRGSGFTTAMNNWQELGGLSGISTGVWHQLWITYDGSNLIEHIDGDFNNVSTSASGTPQTLSNHCMLGQMGDASGQNFSGLLTEVRISNVVRSVAWMQTEYNNQSSPSTFYSVGALATYTVTGLVVKLAGQDITNYVQEETIQIKNTLGQGVGMPAGSTGRSATCQFLTSFGPAASAVGAGSHITSPQLVRMGELQIFDATNTPIFGGYAAELEDKIEKTRMYTQIDGYDYWQHMDRIQVLKLYSYQTDIFIIKDLLKTYASWIDQSALPSFGGYTFSTLNLKAVSLQKALMKITDVTGYQIWVGPDKKIHYVFPSQAQTSPFGLSNSPDFVNWFPFGVDTYVVDDTSAINRVTFYGGQIPSNNFTQDLSTQVNGSNKLFVLGYYPKNAADGSIHVNINNGPDLVLGYLLGTGTNNKFKSQGGLADVLLNGPAHTLTFDVAPSNGSTLKVTYRYEFPMIIQLRDLSAFKLYGQWFDAIISDNTVFDAPTAVNRCRTLLVEQSRGLTTVTCHCYKAGIQAGQILPMYQSIRGINSSYIVQEVDVNPLGAGNFRYDITAGAWNWNLLDVVVSTAQQSQKALTQGASPTYSDANGQNGISVDVNQAPHNATIHTSYATVSHSQPFYARATPVGDGHDAYPGLSTVSS